MKELREVPLVPCPSPLCSHLATCLGGPIALAQPLPTEKDLKSKKTKAPPGHRAVNFYLSGLQQHIFEPQR